jgi:hypothetical protein
MWQGDDGVQRHVGTLDRVDHPEGGTTYQWSTPQIVSASREAVLDAVVEACRSGRLPSGNSKPPVVNADELS